ncbi:hypothetical protein D3C72_2043230 [compost metagenome]
MQHTIFQGFGQAGEELALGQLGAVLAHAPLHQQRRADMAIAVAAALRALIAEPARRIQDALVGSRLQYRA